MPTDQPLWRQLFDSVERAAAPRLESVIADERFAVVFGLVTTIRRDVERRSEQATRRALHRLNLPAGSDVTRLLQEIGKLQREVQQLRRQLEEREGTDDAAAGTNRSRGAAAPRR